MSTQRDILIHARAVLALAACLAAAGSALAQSFTGLGFLPEGFYSQSMGVSGDGSVAVGFSTDSTGHNRAFRCWTRGGVIQDLGTLPGDTDSQAHAVSGDGSVIVGESWNANVGYYTHAFRWTSGEGMQDLDTLPGGNRSSAYGVSGDGSVVVGGSSSTATGNAFRAFRWTSAGGMQDLGSLPGDVNVFSTAYGINGDGSVVVGQAGLTYHACRWTVSGGIQDLGTLPGGSYSSARAVSADGSVVTGFSQWSNSSNPPHAFRWTSAGMVNLGTVSGGHESSGHAVSGDGQVVVGYNHGTGGYDPLLWNPALGMVGLNTYLPTLGIDLTGWTLDIANGVSAEDRTIVGVGTHDGRTEAWVARLSHAGDLDADCDVDLQDMTFLLAHFGAAGGTKYTDGDLNGDGDVDLNDLEELLVGFGTTCP